VGVRLQPATELGHLPRHDHAGYVLRALLPAPAPKQCSCTLSTARCAHCDCSPPAAPRRGPAARPASYALLVRPSAESVRLQPGAQLGHLQRHEQGPHVQSALLPARPSPPNHCGQTPCPRGTSRTASPCVYPREGANIHAACAPVVCHTSPPALRMPSFFDSAVHREWPAHLSKPQPTSNRSPQPIHMPEAGHLARPPR
jgi:hypothetical protein